MFDFSVLWLLIALVGLGLLVYAVAQAIRRWREPGAKEKLGLLICAGLVLLFVPFFGGPMFAPPREKSYTASCMSNLKQLSLGLLMYAEDHEGYLPPADRWCDAVYPYVKNPAMFDCPEEGRNRSVAAYSYALNANLSGINQETVVHPAKVILLFDSDQGVKNAADVGQSLRFYRETRYRFFREYGIVVPLRAHMGGYNFAFLDGHVRWFSHANAPPPGTGMWCVNSLP